MQHQPPPAQHHQAASSAMRPPVLPQGTLLAGRYLVQGYIGGGGFAHIYLVRDTVLGHRRALKEAFYRDLATQRQFRLEAEFLLNVRHPNLVRGYAVFEQQGRFYLVMDYVDGRTLEEIAIEEIRRTHRPPSEARVLDWILPICDAVRELHEQPTPIIHRDIKPANIKLTRDGTPVLIDLGLAKLFAEGSQTIGAALAFTPGYAPPEQYQASGSTDTRTDVYAMGASLYFLLTGYQPIEAPARIGNNAQPSLRSLNPALSSQSEAIVRQAMELEPEKRFGSMGELEAQLRTLRSMLTVQVASPAGPREAAAPEPEGVTCPRCGARNAASVSVCASCGRSLAAPVAPVAREALPPARPPAPVAHPPTPHAIPPVRQERRPRVSASAPVAIIPGKRVGGMRRFAATVADEAFVLIATVLAVNCIALSLLALFSPWMLLFVLPALALAGWSVRRRAIAALPEFRKIAVASFALASIWPVVWGTALLVSTSAHR